MYVCITHTYVCIIRAPCLLIFSLIRNVGPKTGQNPKKEDTAITWHVVSRELLVKGKRKPMYVHISWPREKERRRRTISVAILARHRKLLNDKTSELAREASFVAPYYLSSRFAGTIAEPCQSRVSSTSLKHLATILYMYVRYIGRLKH